MMQPKKQRGLVRSRMMDEQDMPEKKDMPMKKGMKQEMPMKNGDDMPADPNAQKIVMASQKVLYSKGTSDGVVRMLQGKDPVTSLAQTTLFVLKTLFDAAKGKMPKEAMAPAAGSILKLSAELAQAAGVEVSEEQMAQAEALVQQSIQKRFGGQPQQPAAQPMMKPEQPMMEQPEQQMMPEVQEEE